MISSLSFLNKSIDCNAKNSKFSSLLYYLMPTWGNKSSTGTRSIKFSELRLSIIIHKKDNLGIITMRTLLNPHINLILWDIAACWLKIWLKKSTPQKSHSPKCHAWTKTPTDSRLYLPMSASNCPKPRSNKKYKKSRDSENCKRLKKPMNLSSISEKQDKETKLSWPSKMNSGKKLKIHMLWDLRI